MARATKTGVKPKSAAKKGGRKASKASKESKEFVAEVEDDLNKDEIALGSSDDSDDDEIQGLSDDEMTASEAASVGSKTKTTQKSVHSITKPTGKKSAEKGAKKGRSSVIYVGRIPHGFYEAELRKYFKQFGEITRLRLSRNKKSGESKHYAFIEFSDPEVAKVAAETMNNYLLFDHILKVDVIPSERIHDELFVGSNIKYKPVPWKKISQQRHDAPKTIERWAAIKERAAKALEKKQKELDDAGIEFDVKAVFEE